MSHKVYFLWKKNKIYMKVLVYQWVWYLLLIERSRFDSQVLHKIKAFFSFHVDSPHLSGHIGQHPGAVMLSLIHI